MASDPKDSTDRRTQLAADRTLLASERTYAAWMRTGLAALASGVGAKALLDGEIAHWLATATAVLLLIFAGFCFVAGVWREIGGAVPRPRTDMARLPTWLLLGSTAFWCWSAPPCWWAYWCAERKPV
ncbi:YidH family protein [Novosphingobium sp. 9]|uniref:YidH family protein n=1 Tax=Novosphingobium sp. 9 TaxID=2025349 RepID=UPI0021B6BDAF|nr:DUF202 domain-containing protein [Novosphingobium sp. 9]